MKKSKLTFLIFLFFLTIFGFVSVFYSWQEGSRKMAESSLAKTRIFVSGINEDVLKKLKPEIEDEERKDHLFVKEKLNNFLQINKDVRFAYFYIEKEGELYFLVDGEDTISADYSYPGQLYEEASDEYYLPFVSKEAAVTDPVTDRWGTWISVLVPLIDSETNEVIAVLGVDFDAWQWRQGIFSTVFPVGIIFLIILVFCYALFFITYRKEKKSLKSVRWRVLPVFIILLAFIIAIAGFVFFEQEESHKDYVFDSSIRSTQKQYEDFLEKQAEMLKVVIAVIEKKEGIVEDIREKRKEKLLEDWEDVFVSEFKGNNITHFYFFDADRVCFLRVHNPEKSGDVINRRTTLVAEETGEISHGVEIGPLGTLTMRVVKPIYEENEIIGYIEIGKEIEDVLEKLHKEHLQETLIVIRKDYLSKDVWEKGMEMLGREHDWNLLKENAFIYSSVNNQLCDEFLQWVDFSDSDYDGTERRNSFSSEESSFLAVAIPLVDFSQEEVGKLIILRDNYLEQRAFYQLINIVVLLSLFIFVLSIVITYVILKITDKDILAQEEEIRCALKRYDELSAQSRTFDWEVDKDARYTHLSDNAKEIIGYAKDEIVGQKTVFDLHPEKGRQEFKEGVLEILEKKEKMYNVENPIKHKDGSVIWVLSSGLPVLDKKGGLIGYRGSDLDITEKKKAEENLKEREEQFELSVKGSNDGIWDWNLVTSSLYFSPRWKEQLGYGDEELENDFSTFENLLYPEDKERVLEYARKYIEGSVKRYENEFRMLHKDGNYRWILARAAAVYDESGTPYRIAGSHTDITERRNYELMLRESEEKFRQITENTGEVFWLRNAENTKMLYINPAYEKVWGRSRESLYENPQSFIDAIFDEDKAVFFKAFQDYMSTGEFNLEYRIVKPDEEIRWIRAKSFPVKNEKNETTRHTGIAVDITEQKEAEKRMVEKNEELEKFQLAVQNASDHIVITDRDGICLYMNDAAERITGFKKEEIIGKKVGTKENWGGLLNIDDYKKLWRIIKEEKKSFFGEITNKRKRGEEYIAKASISPIINEKGEVSFFVGIERDVTEERRIDQAKTEFVSLASHQLRTPLTAINWYTEMLLSGDAGEINEEQKKYLNEVYSGNQRMVELVNALLNVSRLELGTFVIEPEDVDLVALASNAINELRPQIEGKNQLFEDFYLTGMPRIKGDPKLLNIIFQNLLSNAVKYTPEKGRIKLEISLTKSGDVVGEKEMKKEGFIIIVSDNGYGIPYHQQEKIFSKLFRADNILERDTEGTGLGLYIIKSIAEHSEGDVWFNSEEGKGTTFYVFFPIDGMREKKGTKPLD